MPAHGMADEEKYVDDVCARKELDGPREIRGRREMVGRLGIVHRSLKACILGGQKSGPNPKYGTLNPEPCTYTMLGLDFTVRGSGFRVRSSGFRIQGSKFRVQDLGFEVQGSVFRVRCSGPEVSDLVAEPKIPQYRRYD